MLEPWGGAILRWRDDKAADGGCTVWHLAGKDSDWFAPSAGSFMINYRVPDLHGLVRILKEEGCNVLDKLDESEYGKFAWVIDPDGNKVELWQPPQGQ